jgi:hypothetical protein
MFKRTDSLRRKIIAACIVGLVALTSGPCVVETCHNISANKARYSLAKSKVQEKAEYDHVPGTSSYEWRSVYNMLGLEYDPRNPKKLSQENLDNILGRFGCQWNGKEYPDEKF